jgi:hypothetical protein
MNLLELTCPLEPRKHRERALKESSKLRFRSTHGVESTGACIHLFSEDGC